MTPWFLTRSSIASALFFWHQASLMTLQAAQAFSTIALRSGGRRGPLGLVDDQLAGGRRLVPAGGVVVFGHLVQAELAVEIGPDEFGRVDHAALERREDLARRSRRDIDAELLVDAARRGPGCAS